MFYKISLLLLFISTFFCYKVNVSMAENNIINNNYDEENYYDEYDDYEGYRSYGNYYGRTKKKDLKVRKLSKDEEEIVRLTTSAKYWNLFKEQN